MLKKWIETVVKIFRNILQKANKWGKEKQEKADKILEGYGIKIK